MTTKKAAHTPTPWKVRIEKGQGENKPRILIEGADAGNVALMKSVRSSERNSYGALTQSYRSNETVEANAAYIVRAVNAHEELVEVVKLIQRLSFQKGNTELMRRAKQAIAAAEEK
jgi:hypothetical protein